MLRWTLLGLLALTAACDPCAGVGTCAGPEVRYTGTILDPFDRPAEGVLVEFVGTGGVALQEERLSATTDSAGRFVLEGRARDDGQVIGSLLLHPPSQIAPPRVVEVTMATSRAAGELRWLGEWQVPYPYIALRGDLYHRSTGLPPAKGIEVEFKRTGGIRIEPDSFVVRSDSLGHFYLRPQTLVAGEVMGDLTIRLLPPFKPYHIPGVRLTTFATPQHDAVMRIGIGYRFPYSGILVWEGTATRAEGVRVEFRRTGGIPIYPETYVTETDQNGTFLLSPTPVTSGEVVGDVVVHPPEPLDPYVIAKGVRLRTVEDDRSPVVLGSWTVPGGPAED